jgi:hypothetical protein
MTRYVITTELYFDAESKDIADEAFIRIINGTPIESNMTSSFDLNERVDE